MNTVTIERRAEKELTLVQADVQSFQSLIDSLPSISEMTASEWKELSVRISSRLKQVDEFRTWVVKPLNETVREVNSRFKAVMEPMKILDSLVRDEIGRYELQARERVEEQGRQARIQLQALHEQQAEDDKRMADAIGVPIEDLVPAHELEIEVIHPESTEYVASGSVTVTPRWTFEVYEPQEVPRELCQPVEKLIRAEMNRVVERCEQKGLTSAGTQRTLESHIPGVHFERKMQTRNRTAR